MSDNQEFKKASIFQRYLKTLINVQLLLMVIFLILCFTLKNEMLNLHKLSIENQKKMKLKNNEVSSYNYTTLVILSAIPLTNSLAIDRFYIGNKYAPLKLIVNLFTFGLSSWIWWLIDLIKVLNCTMLDKDGKIVCDKK